MVDLLGGGCGSASLQDLRVRCSASKQAVHVLRFCVAECRERVFRKDFKVDPAEIQTIEQQLVTLMNGEAPDGWVFEDVQETFVVDDTGRGQWVPSAKVAAMAAKRKKNAG